MFNIKRYVKFMFIITVIYISISIMIPFKEIVAASSISISGPTVVIEGQSAVFNVVYPQNAIYINLSSGDVVLNGFQATISVTGSGNSRKIILNNVRGTGNGRSISIATGTGYIGSNKIEGVTSNAFRIKGVNDSTATPKPNKPQTNVKPNNTTPPVNNNQQQNGQENKDQNNNAKEEPEKKEEENKEQNKEEQPDKNIDYDAKIPIPNTGK